MAVLVEAWKSGIATKGNTSRYEADWIAAAASRGFLTTQEGADTFGRTWRITPSGLQYLWLRLGLET